MIYYNAILHYIISHDIIFQTPATHSQPCGMQAAPSRAVPRHGRAMSCNATAITMIMIIIDIKVISFIITIITIITIIIIIIIVIIIIITIYY